MQKTLAITSLTIALLAANSVTFAEQSNLPSEALTACPTNYEIEQGANVSKLIAEKQSDGTYEVDTDVPLYHSRAQANEISPNQAAGIEFTFAVYGITAENDEDAIKKARDFIAQQKLQLKHFIPETQLPNNESSAPLCAYVPIQNYFQKNFTLPVIVWVMGSHNNKTLDVTIPDYTGPDSADDSVAQPQQSQK